MELPDFRASPGWLNGWKRRYSVGFRRFTNTSQKVPKDYADKLQQFRKSIIAIRKAKDIPPSRIINMDQTMCRFDMPPRGTNNRKGQKTIRGKTTKADKKGFTVALAATASGEKLPAVILFKERAGVLGKRVKSKLTVPNNVRVRASTNCWMTREEYHHWLAHVYKDEDEPRLLVVDSYKPHVSDESREIVVNQCNSSLVIIPGGCTSIAQPMDRSVNKPFKDNMRESWTSWMKMDQPTTKMGNLKQPTRQDVIDWVSKAWASIRIEIITKSFLNCGISNALDGTQDDCTNSDIPLLEEEDEGDPDEMEAVDDGDVDDMGNPFSDDEDEDSQEDSEDWLVCCILSIIIVYTCCCFAHITLHILLCLDLVLGWAYFQVGWAYFQVGWAYFQVGWAYFQVGWAYFQVGWAYFQVGWAYFRVQGGPIFGRGVLENKPIPLFEQILNSSPMGVFSRDYGTALTS